MYDNVRKPESDWYEAGYTAPRTDAAGTGCYDSYWSPSQAAAPKKKPHQGLKITMIILGVLVLIIASCYVFAGRGRDSISVDGDPGQHGSVTLPREDTDDDTTVTGKNELPTAPTDPGVTMTLQPAGGSALTLQSVYAKCLPSVVGIHADIRRGEYSTGTGIVLTADGYIVTNTHVLDGAKAVTVTTSDGTEYTGKLVGADAVSDIAVLKIGVGFKRPPAVPVGTSADLKVGQKVFAIGNPFGLDWTLTTGIVSALDRSLPGEAGGPAIDHLIQTDAAINPGNSGGPLLDSAGRLIGINTAIYSPSGASAGIGFAVPVDTVMRVVPQLIKTGKYIRPALGIEVDEQINARLQALTGSKGVFVLRVTPGSAAHRAGLVGVEVTAGGIVPGDRVISIDGIAVDDVTTLQARLDDKNVGDVVVLLVERAGKTREMLVELQPGV